MFSLKRNILTFCIFVCLCSINSYANEYMKSIQQKLYDYGYLCNKEDVTGFLDESTESAFNNFKIRNCITDLEIDDSNALTYLSSIDVIENTIDYSSEKKFIKKYQQILRNKFYYNGPVDGVYSVEFEEAVKKYQKKMVQICDGYITPVTRMTLDFNNSKHTAYDFIRIAKMRLECPYVLGTQGPINYDCSGYVYWCLKQLGINKERIGTSLWQYDKDFTKINDKAKLIKGDLILWNGHMGIMMSPDTYIDCSLSKKRVCERDISEASNLKFVCGFRIFE